MNKLILYVLLLTAVAVVFAQNQPTQPSGAPDQGTQAAATPTPAPGTDSSAVPQPSATPDTGATALPTPMTTATPAVDTSATAQTTPTPQVALTPEVAATATPEVPAAQTTPTPVAAAATATPVIALTNRKDIAGVPSDSDMYCSGFISRRLPAETYVVGGLGSPNQTRFEGPDTIYLHGPTLPTGSKVLLLRHVADPMAMSEAYPGQLKIAPRGGDVYQELGIATINGTMNKVMVANFNLVCDPVLPADIAIPLPDRIRPAFRPAGLFTERIGEPSGKLTGRIILAGEFDWVLGTGSKAYLDLGSNQLKPGDYFKITRTYQASMEDPVDHLEFKNNTDELTRKQVSSAWHRALVGHDDRLPAFDAKRQVGGFPRKTIGELMVLYTTPTSATVVVTASLEPIYIGDMVEIEETAGDNTPNPVTFLTAEGNGSSSSANANAPTITCQAASPAVHAGETASVTCDVSSPDNHPVTVSFEASRGRMQTMDRSASIDTRGLDPGPLSVRAVVTDDRNLSNSASTLLHVEEPLAEATPTPSKVADLSFKRNSSYVDNRSKAVLDDVALRLQKDPTSTAVLIGSSSTGEPTSLAAQRAKNAATYLTKDKGIGADRIQSKAGPASASGTEVWILPAGTTLPDTTPVNSNPTNPTQPDTNTPAPTPPLLNPGTTTPPGTTTTPGSTTPPGAAANPGGTTGNPEATTSPDANSTQPMTPDK